MDEPMNSRDVLKGWPRRASFRSSAMAATMSPDPAVVCWRRLFHGSRNHLDRAARRPPDCRSAFRARRSPRQRRNGPRYGASAAGAEFIVSPCWIDEVFAVADVNGIPYLPGAATPGEIHAHRRNGAAIVKVFPAREAGDPGFVKAMKSVFPDIPLKPTGGIRPADVAAALSTQGYARLRRCRGATR